MKVIFTIQVMNASLSYQLSNAARRFHDLLESLNVDRLTIDEYPKFYLRYLLQHKEHYIDLYTKVLLKLLNISGKQPHELVLVDYGTGNGLLAMLGAVTGFSKVIAVDADPVFLKAAQLTAEALAMKGIEFVQSTEENMDEWISLEQPAVLAGTDVIEHIYNLELFFQQLYHITNIEALVFTTASNPENPFIARKYKRMHLKEELIGGDVDDRKLFGDAHASFLSIRKKMIREYQPQLNDDVLNQLATATRGLKRKDIEKFVEAYMQNGIMGTVISHPTNTCDPETGSWAERMMAFKEFQTLFHKNGFQLQVSKGFYDRYKGNNIKRIIITTLNAFVKHVPYFGMKLSPFVFLEGKRKD
ncbi:MAG: 50S ribosomal protein L11 methyltransferase [Chitinophagaceae bacterium]|nr:50S ribosomal protein L11 methyltransferase [Chitinophagaceae bacterium]